MDEGQFPRNDLRLAERYVGGPLELTVSKPQRFLKPGDNPDHYIFIEISVF